MSGEPRFRDLRRPLLWDGGAVLVLDQRRLPTAEVWQRYTSAEQVARAIQQMVIRGAPAIGCAAAMGLAASARSLPDDPGAFWQQLQALGRCLGEARPTAVNLAGAVRRQLEQAREALARGGAAAARRALEQGAEALWQEDLRTCQAMGALGAELLDDPVTVLTHCNTGALATGGHGTALGVIRSAVAAGKRVRVLADETRPLLQGSRLTAWELMQEGIDVTLVCDSMAAHLLRSGEVGCVIVGADRVARNGDTANKIGTYGLAVLARHHGIPFYVAAPLSTVDGAAASGEQIPLEQRDPEEVTCLAGRAVAPRGCKARNVAFDVTPGELITALITEAGVARPPYPGSIAGLLSQRAG